MQMLREAPRNAGSMDHYTKTKGAAAARTPIGGGGKEERTAKAVTVEETTGLGRCNISNTHIQRNAERRHLQPSLSLSQGQTTCPLHGSCILLQSPYFARRPKVTAAVGLSNSREVGRGGPERSSKLWLAFLPGKREESGREIALYTTAGGISFRNENLESNFGRKVTQSDGDGRVARGEKTKALPGEGQS